MMKNVAVIAAAGTGRRFKGATPKQFIRVGGKEILAHTLLNFEREKSINGILVVASKKHLEYVRKNIVKKYRLKKVFDVIEGGKERYNSVFNAVKYLEKVRPDNVLIHDGVRPVFSRQVLKDVIRSLKKDVAVIPVGKITGTVKLVYGGHVVKTLDRESLRVSNTPQGFRFSVLRRFYNEKNVEKHRPTDEAAAFEKAGYKVKIIEDEGFNLKITTKEDLKLIRRKLK